MIKALLALFVLACVAPLQADILTLDVPAPDFSIGENTVFTETGHYTTIAGLPKLPCRRVTVALPPGAVLESVEFNGNLEELTRMEIAPRGPFMPISNSSAINRVQEIYEERKKNFYSSSDTWPDIMGEVLSKGKLRKYQVIELACYHFAYEVSRGILSRNSADYLYEEEGLDPTTYPCTMPLTLENTIACWSRKGIVLEYNHGARSADWYARKVWSWDDGDGVAESFEITWPRGLSVPDVYELDNDYPATTFLRSCMLSNPDVDSFAKYLLHNGASSVFGSSRILWASRLEDEGMGYHLLNRLMKTRRLSKGIVGKAFDIARIDFMEVNDFWINLYLIHHYGDPALRQFGRVFGHHIDDPVAADMESADYSTR